MGRHLSAARVAPERFSLELSGAHGSRSSSSYEHAHTDYPNAIVVEVSGVQQTVDGVSSPRSKKAAASLVLQVHDHVFVSAAAKDAYGRTMGGKIDADGTITVGPLPLGVKLNFSNTKWSVEPKKLLVLLCMLGSSDGVEALSKLGDDEGVMLLHDEIGRLDSVYLTMPIDAWCVKHFSLIEGHEASSNTMVKEKLERWCAAGWTLAHILVQQVMCGSSDVIEDYGAAYGTHRLTAQWNWCTGEYHSESGSAVAQCVLKKLAENYECFVCKTGEDGDTPLHLLCRTFTNRVIEERYVVRDGVPVRRVFAVGSGATSASAHVPHNARPPIDGRKSRSNFANLLTSMPKESEEMASMAAQGKTSFAAGAGVPDVRTGRCVDLPALDKPRVYSQGAADLPLAAWLDEISEYLLKRYRENLMKGYLKGSYMAEEILTVKNFKGESPIQALMRNNGLQEGWIEKSYELCPAAWTEVYTGDAGEDRTLLHNVMEEAPHELAVLTVPLIMEAIKVLPVSLMAKETVDKLTPVHYLMDNEELCQKVLNDARVDLYPLFAVALQHRGKMQTIIDTYKEKAIESLVFEPETEEVENHRFDPSLHARDVVALLTGYSPGHKLWSFAFDYLQQPQLLQPREATAADGPLDGPLGEDEEKKHYSHYRAWPETGNTFPSGSCEVRGDTVGSDDAVQTGVSKSRLVEWEYWMRQMLTCKNPTVRTAIFFLSLGSWHPDVPPCRASCCVLPWHRSLQQHCDAWSRFDRAFRSRCDAHRLPLFSLHISGAASRTSSRPRSLSSRSPASSTTMPGASSCRTSPRVARRRSTPFLPLRLSTPASFAGERSACGTTTSGFSRSAYLFCSTRSPPLLDLSRSTTRRRGSKL